MKKAPFAAGKIVREHDELYLRENRKKKPKEYFKFIRSIADPFLSKRKEMAMLDIGCATGDFLHFLHTHYPSAHLTGVDPLASLLKKAAREVPEAHFVRGDIYSGKSLPKKKFDAVFMLGVHSIFDEIEPWLKNIDNLLASGGRAYVFGLFNPKDVDVLMRTRYAGRKNEWQSGWNMFSEKSMREQLAKQGLKGTFHAFHMPFDLPEQSDPLRSWTFKLEGGKRGIVNGTQIVHYLTLLEIQRKGARK